MESREVHVARTQLRAVFDRDGGKMRIRSQISAAPERLKQIPQQTGVLRAGMKHLYGWLIQPHIDEIEGLGHRQRMHDNPLPRSEPKKGDQGRSRGGRPLPDQTSGVPARIWPAYAVGHLY
jgi:hypothetical protein